VSESSAGPQPDDGGSLTTVKARGENLAVFLRLTFDALNGCSPGRLTYLSACGSLSPFPQRDMSALCLRTFVWPRPRDGRNEGNKFRVFFFPLSPFDLFFVFSVPPLSLPQGPCLCKSPISGTHVNVLRSPHYFCEFFCYPDAPFPERIPVYSVLSPPVKDFVRR